MEYNNEKNYSRDKMPTQNFPGDLAKYQVPFQEFPPTYPPTIDEVTSVFPDEVPRRDGPGGENGDNRTF